MGARCDRVQGRTPGASKRPRNCLSSRFFDWQNIFAALYPLQRQLADKEAELGAARGRMESRDDELGLLRKRLAGNMIVRY